MKLIRSTHYHENLLEQFELTEEQLKFLKSPEININVAKEDTNRTPIFGLNEEGIPVVFWCYMNIANLKANLK